jgi:hypothetical protein
LAAPNVGRVCGEWAAIFGLRAPSASLPPSGSWKGTKAAGSRTKFARVRRWWPP